MANRILVTGATGLIGRHVLGSLLGADAEIHACGRGAGRQTVPGVVWHRADVLARDQVKNLIAAAAPDVVIHCAWYTEHGKFWTAPINAEWAAASAALAHEAFARGARRFVGVGTGAEYAPDAPSPLSESASRIVPDTLYGSAKDTARRAIEGLSASLDRSFAWVRVFMLYGEGEHPARLVPSLCRSLVRGEPARMSSGKVVRDFMDARDAGTAIAAVAMSSLNGAVNIGSGVPVGLMHVGQTLARLAARPDLLQIGALPDRLGEPAAIVADITRLTREVNFQPRISLELGLSDALSAWREEARS